MSNFFFGKGVGSKIYDAINNAKHSVFVLSPYLSQDYIDFLLRKQHEGVHVSLVTTPKAKKGGMDEIYKKLYYKIALRMKKRWHSRRRQNAGAFC